MNDKILKHMSHELTFALNQHGKLVNVNSVPNGNECDCFCPACREPLVAKNQGKIKKHHFSHQSGTECEHAYETMLHLLAKEKIQKAFLKYDRFLMSFIYKSYCTKMKECHNDYVEECCKTERKTFNLKKYYDSCEQEKAYNDIKRRSDLKIYSTQHPNREPIYIEFWVTHASDNEKLHSGNRIIEILIENEDDIDNIVKNGIHETEFIYEDEAYRKIAFFGFINQDNENKNIKKEIPTRKCVLYKSGKIHCFDDSEYCNSPHQYPSNTLMGMCFPYFTDVDFYSLAKYLGYQKFHIPNCGVCKNYVGRYGWGDKICRLYKYLQIPKYEQIDTSRARSCSCFILNKEEMDEILSKNTSSNYNIILFQ